MGRKLTGQPAGWKDLTRFGPLTIAMSGNLRLVSKSGGVSKYFGVGVWMEGVRRVLRNAIKSTP